MANLIKFDSSSHWYRPDGSPKHDADLRLARKERLFPSVTSIDKAVFVNDFLQRWKMNELVTVASETFRQPHESSETYAQRIYELSLNKSRTAAAFGERLHDAIDKYPVYPDDSKLHPWIDCAGRWIANNVVETYHSEKTLVDQDIGVAGRCDRIFLHKDYGRTIADYKSQDVKKDNSGKKLPAWYESWPRQLAFYAVCDAKERGVFPDEIPTCISLIFDSNEACDPFERVWTPEEIRLSYERFLTGAWMWFEGMGKRKPYWPCNEWNLFDNPPPRITEK